MSLLNGSNSAPLYKTGKIFTPFILATSLSTSPIAAQSVQITIYTTTANGQKIRADITKKHFPNIKGEQLFIVSQTVGETVVLEKKCDKTVLYQAKSSIIGINRTSDSFIPCQVPNVVFKDFVVSPSKILFNNVQFQTAKYWKVEWGLNVDPTSKIIATELALAYSKQQYGKIAIMGQELAKQYQLAGQKEAANFFSSLSVDATARGTASFAGIDPAKLVATAYSSNQSKYVLTPESKKLLTAYQTEKLDIVPSSTEFGKTGWQTMKSLSGGTTANVKTYNLSPRALRAFNPKMIFKSIKPDM